MNQSGLSDVITINRYHGWCTQSGNIRTGTKNINEELDRLHDMFDKPIIISDFGVDAHPGWHVIQD